jgi:hypothetical protein
VKNSFKNLKKRGCVIVRKIAVNTVDADFIREAWEVPNCQTILCTVREVWKDGKLLYPPKKRYFISSLDASQVSPERFLELVQGHWQVALFFASASQTAA